MAEDSFYATRGEKSSTGTNGFRELGEIAVIAKNKRENFQVRLIEINGQPLIDLRVFYVDVSGVQRPSVKGVAMRAEQLHAIIRALVAAEKLLAAGEP